MHRLTIHHENGEKKTCNLNEHEKKKSENENDEICGRKLQGEIENEKREILLMMCANMKSFKRLNAVITTCHTISNDTTLTNP
jgi:hypothetical protein